MENNEPQITIKDLPISFIVKYLGWEPARGLWGMKNTRKPIDNLVLKAKNLSADKILPRVQLIVDKNGLVHRDISNKSSSPKTVVYGVNEISYGVQDIVYSRVFSVIIVTDKKLDEGEGSPEGKKEKLREK
ncbi:hypothetical protein WA026_023031 [Henosepilachna vigintioctopunctata]|uniref:Uncharacterized protein n=1 Tax=Henosepilachna vigintioctopunctata TaxID=420089 RepID=A0AAW1VH35_9CUCU